MHIAVSLLSWFMLVNFSCETDPTINFFDGLDPLNKCKIRLERRLIGLSGILYSHSLYGRDPYNASRNCLLMLIAPVGYRIRLRVIEFDVAGSGAGGHRSCNRDTLHVFDHESTVDPQSFDSQRADDLISPGPIIGQFCGRIQPLTVLNVSSENAMSLWWHANAEVENGEKRRGFKLHWNAFRTAKKDELTVPCSKNREFACGNAECIPAELACDSYADCVYQEDLIPSRQISSKCANVYLDPISSFSGVAILLFSAFIVFIICILCLSICCICRCLKSKSPPQKEPSSGVATNLNKPSPPQFLLPSPPKIPPPSAATGYSAQPKPAVMISPSMARHPRSNKRILNDQTSEYAMVNNDEDYHNLLL